MWRSFGAVATAALIWTAGAAVAADPAVPYAIPLAQRISGPDWPQTHSDLTPDDTCRYGRLANQMRYIVCHNPAAARATAIRFQIAAGSMEERDDQLGLAHFVEHMAFRGSKRLADGDLDKLLAREGFAFGSDVNAFTGYDTTDYVLNLADDNAMDSAFLILREIAGNLTFDPAAIEKERGVVLGEERMRASPDARADQAWTEAAYPGSLLARRDPIGTIQSIKTAPRDVLVDYYKTWYRPELATLVVVGDVDPDAVVRRIQARFGDWTAAKPGPVVPPDYGMRAQQGFNAVIHTEANLNAGEGGAWIRPYIEGPDTAASRTRGLIKAMVTTILDDRLAVAAARSDASFYQADIDYENGRLYGNTTRVTVQPRPGKEAAALQDVMAVVAQLRSGGVTQAEVDAFIASEERANTNFDRTLVENDQRAVDLLDDLDENGVSQTTAQILAEWPAEKSALTVAAAAEQIKFLFSGDGPILFGEGEAGDTLDAGALKTAYSAGDGKVATGAWKADAAPVWPYTDFGPAVKPVSRTEVDVLNYVHYRFPNGLVVNIRPNPYVRNQIYVGVRFAGGYQLFSPQEKLSLMQLHLYDMVDGGLGRMSKSDIDSAMKDRSVSVSYSLDDDHATLFGETTRDSFTTEMQLLMAYTTDAGFRPDSFVTLGQQLDNMYRSIRASPDLTADLDMPAYLASGDARFVMPTEAEARKTTPDTYMSIYRRTLTHVPVEIDIAGDVSEEAALEQVERTFATLPALPASFTIAPGADDVHLPSPGAPVTFTHQGRADQVVSIAVFPTTDALRDTKTTRGLELLAAVVQQRLSDDLRATQGATYDVSAQSVPSETFKGYGYIVVRATVRPDTDQAFFDTVVKVAGELANAGLSKGELDRIRTPMETYLNDTVKNNADWLATMAGLYGDGRLWDLRTGQAAKLDRVSAADIQRLARTYLRPDAVLRAHALPEDKGKP